MRKRILCLFIEGAELNPYAGRQLFESSKALATSDEALYEEGAAEVDFTQYSREERERERRREEEEEERRRQGLVAEDSDGD